MKYYYYWLAVLVFGLDYITKRLIVSRMELYDQISVIGNFFLITSHRNRGAAFGILQDQRTFFLLITVVVVAGIIGYMYLQRKSGNWLLLSGLGMVLGGALGNFLDRARAGEVVDFMQFNFGSYTFPIFNVADMGIVIGVGFILLDSVLDFRRQKSAAVNDGEAEGSGAAGLLDNRDGAKADDKQG